jgi:hypothetical protein
MKMTAILARLSRASAPSELHSRRAEVCPPSLRHAPDSTLHRLLFWLLAPAPYDAAPPPSRLQGVRTDFLAAITDIDSDEADALRRRIAGSRSLRELWHLRSELYRLVGVCHDQTEAERRLAALARHFTTRGPSAPSAAP